MTLILRAQNLLLCALRKWWRPLMLAGVAVGTWIDLVIIPIVKWEVPNMAEAAAWIAACGALSWVRHLDKSKGVGE